MKIQIRIDAPVVTAQGDTIATGTCVCATEYRVRPDNNKIEIFTQAYRSVAACNEGKLPINVDGLYYQYETISDADMGIAITPKAFVANKMKTKLDAIYGAASVTII